MLEEQNQVEYRQMLANDEEKSCEHVARQYIDTSMTQSVARL
jgi:hypothetical protein